MVRHPRLVGAFPLAMRIEVVAAATFYVLAVHWSYRLTIVPDWGHTGLIFEPAPDGSLALAMVCAVLPAFWLPIGRPSISAITLWILYAVPYVPASLVPHYLLGTGWSLAWLNAALVFSMGLLALGQRIPRPSLVLPAVSEAKYATAAAILGLVVAVVLIAAFGVGGLPALGDVYGTRADYKEAARELGRIFGYLIGAAGNVLYPLLVVLAVLRRRWDLAVIGLGGIFLVYSITGYKSVLFTLPLALGVLLLVRFVSRAFAAGALLGLAGAIVIAALSRLVVDGLLAGLVIRRAIDVPGQLTAYYYDYFSTHPTYGLSHSILGWFMDPQYSVTPPRLIASVYFGNEDANSNANLWADGFANFGLGGIIGVTLLLVALVWLADVIACRKRMDIAAPVFASAAFSLTNSALLTSLLSHGLVVALVAIALLPDRRDAPAIGWHLRGRIRGLPTRPLRPRKPADP